MNNKDLELEILKIRLLMEQAANKKNMKLYKEYKKQLDKLRAKVGTIYMQYDYDDENGFDMTQFQKNKVMKEIENELVDIHKWLTPFEVMMVYEILNESYKNTYYRTAYTIDKGVNIGINYKLLRQEFIDSYINYRIDGMTYSDRIWKNKDWMINKLYESLGQAIYDGKDVRKLAKEMSDIFGSSAYQSQRLINTELARVVTQATEEIYKDSGVVDKVQWCATLELDRTCEDCQNLDGKIFDLSDIYKPEIPLHVSCRCTWIPVIDDWNPKIRRDQDVKENINYTDFKSWSKSKNIDD